MLFFQSKGVFKAVQSTVDYEIMKLTIIELTWKFNKKTIYEKKFKKLELAAWLFLLFYHPEFLQ